MQGFKGGGDVKEVLLTIRAISYFHKTVASFLLAVKNYTQEQTTKYCALLVAEYQQFQGL